MYIVLDLGVFCLMLGMKMKGWIIAIRISTVIKGDAFVSTPVVGSVGNKDTTHLPVTCNPASVNKYIH